MQLYDTVTTLLALILIIGYEPLLTACDESNPMSRWANSCTILEGSLVCFGGETSPGVYLNDLYRLDLDHVWNTAQPRWTEIQTPVPIKSRAYFGSAPCWNKGFVINGGTSELGGEESQQSISTTFTYNIEWNSWSKPYINDHSNLPPRRQHTATSDYQGRIWMWGGVSDSTTYKGNGTAYYSLWTMIDTNTWSYSTQLSQNDNPPPRIDHTATLISNEVILIIGGMIYARNVTDPSGSHSLLPVSMNQIMLYNTSTGKWRNHTAGGNIPAPRRGHSAVLDRNIDSIIVFGGGTHNDEQVLLNDVFVLQLENLEWSSPSIIGTPPEPRKYHQANLMDKLMLVTFGMGNEGLGHNDVRILDTGNWEWISKYTPNPGWLSGNINSTSGIIRNNTWIFGKPYLPKTQDPKGAFPSWADPNSSIRGDGMSSDNGETHPQDNTDESKVKAGIIAAVISGAVVVLGGSIFLVIRKVVHRERQARQHQRQRIQHLTLQDYNELSKVISHGDSRGRKFIKPDDRSSCDHAYDDGEHHKPNEYDRIPSATT